MYKSQFCEVNYLQELTLAIEIYNRNENVPCGVKEKNF